jgi:hypothetical protein
MQAVARSALEAAEQKAAARRARKARQNEQEIQREVILSRRFSRFLRFETNSVLRFSFLSLMLMSAYSTLKVPSLPRQAQDGKLSSAHSLEGSLTLVCLSLSLSLLFTWPGATTTGGAQAGTVEEESSALH